MNKILVGQTTLGALKDAKKYDLSQVHFCVNHILQWELMKSHSVITYYVELHEILLQSQAPNLRHVHRRVDAAAVVADGAVSSLKVPVQWTRHALRRGRLGLQRDESGLRLPPRHQRPQLRDVPGRPLGLALEESDFAERSRVQR